MFESAEIGHKISRKAYKQQEPALRSALLAAQYALLAQGSTPPSEAASHALAPASL